MSKPAPSLSSAPHSQELPSGLAKVPATVDHDAMIQELAEAVAANDRDRIFRLAAQLVDEVHINAEQTNNVEDRWMTVEEVAGHANVSRMTVWRWRNDQGLKFTKVGSVVRIRRSELDGFLMSHIQG